MQPRRHEGTKKKNARRVIEPSWLPFFESSWSRFAVGVALGAGVLLFFSPGFSYPFLNWDDREELVRNAALHAEGLARWAFTTTYMEHYQPLAWLVWGIVDRAWTLTPTAAHALSVGLHAACAVLVFVLARRLIGGTVVASVAALLFAIHPLRVEVVAWASAMPYALALFFALLSVLVFLDGRGHGSLFALSIAFYAMSLLARPIAIGLPIVRAVLKGPPYDSDTRAPDNGRRAGLSGPPVIVLPFAVLAI